MRTSPPKVIPTLAYPQLSEWHILKLLEAACVAFIRTPKKVLNGGAIVMDYPSAAVVKRGSIGHRRPYLGYLQPNGEVVVRTIDGAEVARGALGYVWELPAFEAHRKAATAKKGK